MSRPKTGSVTALAVSGENGTRLIQSRTVSQPAATDPPTVRATRTLTTTSAMPAMGVRSGMSSAPMLTGRGVSGA